MTIFLYPYYNTKPGNMQALNTFPGKLEKIFSVQYSTVKEVKTNYIVPQHHIIVKCFLESISRRLTEQTFAHFHS